ncbi:uncharacterized protein LOC118455684 [Neolamprologus brichardi]|uniref:uncharacterized protein LOC118455684 n=1 Tax=Neolamprologus brichardi TaxID=32507 RepID=UPI001643E87B|nr:uncharacterized protein LOC118455684 [Neolamprologus brichardi]
MDDDKEILLKKLNGLVTNIKWSPKNVTDLFDALLKRFESTTNNNSHFLTWMIKMLHCIEIYFITSDWKDADGKTLLELLRDKTVTDETLKEYLANDREKTLEEIIDEIRQEKLNQVDVKILDDIRDIVSTVHQDCDIKNYSLKKSELKSILKNLLLQMEKKSTPFRPRLTQMVSWCLMALSETGRLIQVGTGEGKSCIVAMFAAFRALKKENVDIMSSSSVLAERDFKEWEGFYKELNITADYNCNRSIYFTPCELNQAKSSCYIPGFFSELVKSKLNVWIENAFKAQVMTEDHEYVMEKHGIVPVDYSCTGVVENYMKWTDGLQQFIEMKHESKMTDMTAITNYMSNVGLLQKYKNQFGSQIYGMSGTLGQKEEIETLQKIYDGIKTCQIPSFKRRKLFEVEGVVLMDEEDWTEKICDAVIAQTSPTSYRDPRAVLIICETIRRAKMIYRNLGDRVQNKNLYINNNMDNSVIISKELEAGEVIIATNLAGRGTDLQVSDTVKEAGGLFVLQTFLPTNARVEAQAFGRTARQGSPGSAQLIVCLSHLSELLQLMVLRVKLLSLFRNLTDVTPLKQLLFVMQLRSYQQSNHNEGSAEMTSTLKDILTGASQQEVKIIKQVRDRSVADELSSYLEFQIPDMKKKEELFNDYLDVLDDLYTSSNNKPETSDLSALNEFWGVWLLMSFNAEDSTEELKSRLKTDLDTARQKLRQRESPSSNLYHYISFGNDLREKGKFEESINMYTKAIQKDHCWGAIAYYNRALTSLKQQNRSQSPDCINRALEDLQNALKSVQLHCDQLEVTHRFLTQHTNKDNSDSLTRHDKHLIARFTVLESFKVNITEAIKKVDKARDTGGKVKVEESLVYFMVPLVYFLPFIFHSRQSVRVIRSRDPLMCHQLISHPSFDILNELECLKSLGLTHVYTLDTLFSLGGFFSKIGLQEIDVEPYRNVELECQGPENGKLILLAWKRPDLLSDGYVFFYRDDLPHKNFQDPIFRGRVKLRDPQMKNMDMSIILSNTTINDTGTYECCIIVEDRRQETSEIKHEIRLKVCTNKVTLSLNCHLNVVEGFVNSDVPGSRVIWRLQLLVGSPETNWSQVVN